MIEREQVVRELQEAADLLSAESSYTIVEQWVVRDVLALLKAQAAVRPIENAGFNYCGACGHVFLLDGQKYCPNCGRAVKLE